MKHLALALALLSPMTSNAAIIMSPTFGGWNGWGYAVEAMGGPIVCLLVLPFCLMGSEDMDLPQTEEDLLDLGYTQPQVETLIRDSHALTQAMDTQGTPLNLNSPKLEQEILDLHPGASDLYMGFLKDLTHR